MIAERERWYEKLHNLSTLLPHQIPSGALARQLEMTKMQCDELRLQIMNSFFVYKLGAG